MIPIDDKPSKLTRKQRDFVVRVRNALDSGRSVPQRDYLIYRRLWRLMGGK